MTATTSGNWIEELEEAAADRDLVAGYSSAYYEVTPINSNCYESTSEEKPDKIGQKEFENLYGPLVEHMYFWRPTNCYLGEVPCYLDPAATIEEERKRLAVLSIFKKRSEDEFDALWQKQKDGTIHDKEELVRAVRRMRGWRWFKSSVKFSDARAAALGMAILLIKENDAVSDRLWGN